MTRQSNWVIYCKILDYEREWKAATEFVFFSVCTMFQGGSYGWKNVKTKLNDDDEHRKMMVKTWKSINFTLRSRIVIDIHTSIEWIWKHCNGEKYCNFIIQWRQSFTVKCTVHRSRIEKPKRKTQKNTHNCFVGIKALGISFFFAAAWNIIFKCINIEKPLSVHYISLI